MNKKLNNSFHQKLFKNQQNNQGINNYKNKRPPTAPKDKHPPPTSQRP